MVKDKLKGLSKDALIYGVGDALGRLIGLIMLPILSRIFGPADYGAIDLLQISYVFVVALLTFGVPSGVQRFYFRGEEEDRRALVTSCLVFLVGAALFGSAAIATFAAPLSALVSGDAALLRNAIWVLALQLPIEQIWTYQVLLLRMERRAVTFSMANISMVVLTPTLTFVFVVTAGMGLTGVFLARCISLALVTLVLIAFTRHQYCGQVRSAVVREVVGFALPGHPAQLIRQSMTVIPRYLLAYFAPLAAVGLFGIAMRVGGLVRIYVEAFNRAWNPFAYANEGTDDEPRIYSIVLKLMFTSLVVIGTALSVLAPEALRVLTPAGYEGAAHLIPGVVVYLGIDGLILILSTVLYTRDRVRWSSYLGALKLVVMLALGLVLVPRYHANGLVITLVVASVVHYVAYVTAALSLFRFPVSTARMATVALLAALVVAGLYGVQLPVAALVSLKLIAIAGVGVGATYFILDASERLRARALLTGRA